MNDAQLLKHLAMNGNCSGSDTELFFEYEGNNNYLKENYKTIKKMCNTCPVQRECLDYALRHDVEGIWGGKYHSERKQLRRKLGIKAEQLSFTEYIPKLKSSRDEELLWNYIDERNGVCVKGHRLSSTQNVLISYRERNPERPTFSCRKCGSDRERDKKRRKKALELSTEPYGGYW